MTTKLRPASEYVHLTPLPDPPKPPDAMKQRPHIARADQVLRSYFRRRPDVLVSGEGYLCYEAREARASPHPDCLVALGLSIPPSVVEEVANGYTISEIGQPPDFVLEVASESTGWRDYTVKRDDYARLGVREYWRFDASGGRYHDAALAGDLLVDGAYQPIPVDPGADGVFRGYSAVLGLELHWEDRQLRFFDPVAQEYLPDLVEALEALAAERAARVAAEAQRDAAESRANAAEERVSQLEAQLQQRQPHE